MKYLKSLIIFFVVIISAWSCQNEYTTSKEKVDSTKRSFSSDLPEFQDSFLSKLEKINEIKVDLEEIKKRDTLRAITIYSNTSYFLYRGQPMGYDYELARRFAEYLDVNLEMIIADDINQILDLLIEGKGDVVTYNLTVTSSRRKLVNFSYPLNYTHQVLVQRKPDNWRQLKKHQIENSLIRNPIKLIGLPISVRRNSAYTERLINLEEELGGEILTNYLPGNLSTDRIMEMVSNGEIDYTVADFNIANITASYYQNLDIQTTVGVMQQLSWATRKGSPRLLEEINNWLKVERTEAEFFVIFNKYFKNRKYFKERQISEYLSLNSSKISEFDPIIQKTANSINWDWRFLAAQVYKESAFNPKEKSWAGAVGLMQLMPKTARQYGYSYLTKPKSSLEAGAKHIQYLNKYWKKHIPDSTERIKFVLASYNVGHNHVQDARRLAKKYKYDPNEWNDNVELMLLRKSEKKFYEDPVVKYGYCRGKEPVNYVEDIFKTYQYYKEFIPDINS